MQSGLDSIACGLRGSKVWSALRWCVSLTLWFALSHAIASAGEDVSKLNWFEARTAHFAIYSCAETQNVALLGGRLEQFRDAYAALAGAEAVASPPIVVMAFKDRGQMQSFLPFYQGKPASLSAFFKRGSDQNLVVTSLGYETAENLELIFHEYAHLLMRHNDPYWPLWLKEGMADIYSTLEVPGPHVVKLGEKNNARVRFLETASWMPLEKLLNVTHSSPEYNERQHQGIFYSESWLLADFLMLGDQNHSRNFSRFSNNLKEGQPPVAALTNAFGVSLDIMEKQLRAYFARKSFPTLNLGVGLDLKAQRSISYRNLAPPELAFRLGYELLLVNRPGDARRYFQQAHEQAPKNPLPVEGLGLLAAEEEKSSQAVQLLEQAETLGARNFLTYYVCAREKLAMTSKVRNEFTRLDPKVAAPIRAQLKQCLALMPDFGPGHHLLGFFELVQGENYAEADKHLQRAIQLEPENRSYLLALAQAQIGQKDVTGARKTLELLRLPYINSGLRAEADQLLKRLPP